jgi:RNA polymerase sigma-70 factor, ECF subfamily
MDSEAELVKELRAGDPAAVRGFVAAQTSRMHAVAARILGSQDEAQEIVQEAFLRAFRALGDFRGTCKLSTWLHRIVINEALMSLRGRKSRSAEGSIEVLLPRFYDDGHHVEAASGWSEQADVLLQREQLRTTMHACLAQLPESLRVVLTLRDVEGLDVQETASILEVSQGVVKTRLHRARQAMRALLSKELNR